MARDEEWRRFLSEAEESERVVSEVLAELVQWGSAMARVSAIEELSSAGERLKKACDAVLEHLG